MTAMCTRYLCRAILAIVVSVGGYAWTCASVAAALDIQKVESHGGVRAWLVEDHTNPVISVRFAWRGGSALDPTGKEGLANLVSGLMDEGAGELDSQAFQQALEEHAIRLSFRAGKDTFRGRLAMLTEKSTEAWVLLAAALAMPRFDTEPVDRIRGQILANLRQSAEDPDSIAWLTLFEILFPDHAYARPTDGTPESIAGLTREDLQRFVETRLARDNLVIGVVGDTTPEELSASLDRVFGSLPEKAAGGTVGRVHPPDTGSLTVVRKDIPQSTIVFAQPGPDRHHKDFYALHVMNYLLGDGFTSRLYQEVREARGLAYSVYSYIAPYDHAAIFAGGAGTANARVAETLRVLREQWSKMAENGISAAELVAAKTYLTGSYPLRFTSGGTIADLLVALQLDGLDPEYFAIRNSLIENVTLEQVNAAARRWLDADSLTIVVVGDPENIESSD